MPLSRLSLQIGHLGYKKCVFFKFATGANDQPERDQDPEREQQPDPGHPQEDFSQAVRAAHHRLL